MILESYFEFINDNTIRISGTRVNIETVLRDYNEGASPEEIVLRYSTLSLEQVHATITYYLGHYEQVEAYLDQVKKQQMAAWASHQRQPSPFVQSLRKRLDKQRQLQQQIKQPA